MDQELLRTELSRASCLQHCERLLRDEFCQRANADEALDHAGCVNINAGSVPAKSISAAACLLPRPPLAAF